MKKLILILFLILFKYGYSQEQFTLFFDSNKFELKKSEKLKLNSWIQKNKEVKIIGANGFCDEDGTIGYNDTLAQKRIDFIYNIIKFKIVINCRLVNIFNFSR